MTSLVAEITANTIGLERGLDRAQSRLNVFGRQIGRITRRMAGFGVATIAAGTALGTALTKRSLSAIDAQAKLARQLGTTAGSLAVVERALSLSGKQFSEVREAITNMNRRLGEAARGTGPAVEALDALGLSARELSALPLDQRLQAIALRMQDLNLDAQQQAVIMAQLGSEQGRLFNLLEDGGSVLERATREAQAFGLALSDVDAAKVERANDALSTIGAVITGIGNRIAVRLAPLLEAVANLFRDAAVEADGFRGTVDGAFSTAARVAGVVADAVHYVIAGLKMANFSVNVLGDAFIQTFAFVEKGVRGFLDGMFDRVNNLIAAMNMIPGVEIAPVADLTDRGFGKSIQRFAAESSRLVADSGLDLLEHLNAPLPSDSIKAWLAEVETAARKASASVVASRQGMIDGTIETDLGLAELEKKRAAEEKERQEQRLKAFRFGLLSEEEAEVESYARKLEELKKYREQELISESEHMALKEQVLAEHEARLTDIQTREEQKRSDFARKSLRDKTLYTASEGLKTLAAVTANNKKLFALNKAAAIAGAVVDGIRGALRTWNEYPYPWNIPMTAFHVAGTAARLAQLKSQSFSGGAAGGGGGGGAATGAATAPPAPAAAAPGSVVSINLQGDTFGRQSVIGLIEEINDAVADGARIRFA